MNDYFEGVLQHLSERCKRLLFKIPTGLPREFQLLESRCRDQLTAVLKSIEKLASDPAIYDPRVYTQVLNFIRRFKDEMDHLETVGITALNRSNDEDQYLNRLIEKIRQEIKYPLPSPVISTLSRDYFYIYPQLGLLCVPLSQADFMLHLPDLYHELAHPLVAEEYDPRVQPFRQNLLKSLDYALNFLAKELEKEDTRRSPRSYSFYLKKWARCWGRWAEEFFCDLFAVYTVGPAFAWANVHLCALTESALFHVPTTGSPTSHPSDDARMRVMLFGLELIGFSEDAKKIRNRWSALINTTKEKPSPEYLWCFPDSVLKHVAEMAYTGVAGMGCRIAKPSTNDPIHHALNSAWGQFWQDPKGYSDWERGTIEQLKKIL